MLTIYKASAGSGKTFTLAYEYIKNLLGYKPEGADKYTLIKNYRDKHRSILGITFTNKATEEMKDRIVKELSKLAIGEQSDYLPMLTAEFGCSPEQLKTTAGKVLRNLLFDFNYFNISTIDSFFQTILRTFAREAELTGDYELELDNDDAISEGMYRFFESLNRNDEISRKYIKGITDYLVECLRNQENVLLFSKGSGLNKKLSETVASLSNDTFNDNYKSIKEYFSDPNIQEKLFTSITNKINEQKKTVIALCKKAVDAINSTCGSDAVNRNLFNNIENGAKGKFVCGAVTARVAENEVVEYTKQGKMAGGPTPDSEIVEAAIALKEIAAKLQFLYELRTNMFLLSLMVRIYNFIEEFRVENNALLLSDTNNLLRTIVGDNDTPFIYERLGVMLEHYLIDEFQDTSTIQWDCLQPLVSSGISVGKDSLIIGDEKQCIYRFRNSDPSLLATEVAQQYKEDEIRIIGLDPVKNTNYRSSRDIVEFNNELFNTIAEQIGVSDIYANVKQSISKRHSDHKGYIKIAPLEVESQSDFFDAMLPKLADDIQRQLNSGYSAKDIAVLVRKKDDGQKIISYLISNQPIYEKKFNIISDDLMPVSDSPAVRLIVSTLRSIAYPTEAPSNAKYKTRKETKALISRYEVALHETGDSSDALRLALKGLDIDSAKFKSTTLIDVVEDIIATLPDELVKLHTPYICAFHDLISDYSTFGLNDLQSFLHWWDETGKNKIISSPEDPNAIRIMTIHKSKGLQFRCVHVPSCNWEILSFRSLRWFESKPLDSLGLDCTLPEIVPFKPSSKLVGTPFEEQYNKMCAELTLDELNVLYVAFTRAVDELCAYYFIGKGTDLPVSTLIDEALKKNYPDKPEDSEYIVGNPTVNNPGSDKNKTGVETLFMPDYYTAQVPEKLEKWMTDDTPGEL